MEIIQIIGVGFAGILIAGILKEYKPEFKIYVSIVVGIIIFFIASDKLAIFINLIMELSNKLKVSYKYITKNYGNINFNRICSIDMQR